MTPIKVLLAEDEIIMGKIIKEALESRHFEVQWAIDGHKAYAAFRSFQPDICVLDVMMPYKDGFSVAREIRAINQEIPIIFLTAKSSVQDLSEGFESGANDYVRKPFSMEELIIRMNALVKNNRPSAAPTQPFEDPTRLGSYTFYWKHQRLEYGAQHFNLTHREAQLLKLLIQTKNQILDRKYALEVLWGEDSYFNGRSMDVFISKLRKHMQHDPRIKILNIRGQGYKLLLDE
jgi:DNA-binding response OmpR family regulator